MTQLKGNQCRGGRRFNGKRMEGKGRATRRKGKQSPLSSSFHAIFLRLPRRLIKNASSLSLLILIQHDYSSLIKRAALCFISSSLQSSREPDRNGNILNLHLRKMGCSWFTDHPGNSAWLHSLLWRNLKLSPPERIAKRHCGYICYWSPAYQLIQIYRVPYLVDSFYY